MYRGTVLLPGAINFNETNIVSGIVTCYLSCFCLFCFGFFVHINWCLMFSLFVVLTVYIECWHETWWEMNNCFVAILENRFFSGNMSTHLCEYSFLYCLTVNFSSSNCSLLRNSIWWLYALQTNMFCLYVDCQCCIFILVTATCCNSSAVLLDVGLSCNCRHHQRDWYVYNIYIIWILWSQWISMFVVTLVNRIMLVNCLVIIWPMVMGQIITKQMVGNG